MRLRSNETAPAHLKRRLKYLLNVARGSSTGGLRRTDTFRAQVVPDSDDPGSHRHCTSEPGKNCLLACMDSLESSALRAVADKLGYSYIRTSPVKCGRWAGIAQSEGVGRQIRYL